MSNRFHTKWHRRNHHTYGNGSNPDAGHDPIASQPQPFLGEFCLSGSLSATAPASAFAAFLYSDYTALCAFAGVRGGLFYSNGYLGAEAYSFTSTGLSAWGPLVGLDVGSSRRAVSAYGGFVGGEFYSDVRAISALGNVIGADIYSPVRSISAYGGQVGVDVFSPVRAISAYGRSVGGEFYSDVRAISALGNVIGADIYSTVRAVSAYGRRIGLDVASPNSAISANGGVVAGEFYSRNIALSAWGNNIGASVSSPSRGLSAFGGSVGIAVGSPNIALSAFGGNIGIVVSSNTVALSTNPGVNAVYPNPLTPYVGPNYRSKNVLNNRTGIFTENPLSAFHVTGGSLFDGHVTITGNLSVLRDFTYLDTQVFVTSSTQIVLSNNSNQSPALFVSNTGENNVMEVYDGGSFMGGVSSYPAFIVCGQSARPGWVGMGTLLPNNPLTVVGSISGSQRLQIGFNNTASGSYSTVAGGQNNTASGNNSIVGGGRNNTASGTRSNIGGGQNNTASNYGATIMGGGSNNSSGNYAIVGGGIGNTASGSRSSVLGGSSNTASGNYSAVIGGQNNTTNSQANSFIIGSNLTASQPNFTYVNNISTTGNINTAGIWIYSNYSGVSGDGIILDYVQGLGRISVGNGTGPNESLAFYSNGPGLSNPSTTMFLSANGFVGINKSTPTSVLDVNGTFTANSTTNFAVNINTGSGNAATNINTATNTSALGLGNNSGATNINGSAITLTGATNINSSTATTANVNINTGSTTSASTTNIHTGAITGSLNLGNSNSTTNLNGVVSVNGPFETLVPFTSGGVLVDISNRSTNSIICTSASTLILPSASTFTGRWLYIKATGNFTISSNSNDVVPFTGGAAGNTILTAAANGRWAWLQSDSTNWITMAGSAFS